MAVFSPTDQVWGPMLFILILLENASLHKMSRFEQFSLIAQFIWNKYWPKLIRHFSWTLMLCFLPLYIPLTHNLSIKLSKPISPLPLHFQTRFLHRIVSHVYYLYYRIPYLVVSYVSPSLSGPTLNLILWVLVEFGFRSLIPSFLLVKMMRSAISWRVVSFRARIKWWCS